MKYGNIHYENGNNNLYFFISKIYSCVLFKLNVSPWCHDGETTISERDAILWLHVFVNMSAILHNHLSWLPILPFSLEIG